MSSPTYTDKQVILNRLKELKKQPESDSNLMKQIILLLSLSNPEEKKLPPDDTEYIKSKYSIIQNERVSKGLGRKRTIRRGKKTTKRRCNCPL